MLKVIGFLVLLALIVVGYGYFFDHSLLHNIGLGSLVAAEDAAQAAAAAPPDSGAVQQDSSGLVKCVDSRGSITFSDHPCPQGQKSHSVELSETQIVHLGPTAASAPAQGGQASHGDGHNQTITNAPEDHKQNAQGALYQKFGPY